MDQLDDEDELKNPHKREQEYKQLQLRDVENCHNLKEMAKLSLNRGKRCEMVCVK